MSKPVKYILLGILGIFLIFIVAPFLWGFFTSFNPKEQIELAQKTNSQKALKEAVAIKLNLLPENVELVIDKQDESGDRAVGTLTDKNNPSEKYWWIGINSLNPDTNQKRWLIVSAGDSTSIVTCKSVNIINFPTSLVPACFDDSLQKVVTR